MVYARGKGEVVAEKPVTISVKAGRKYKNLRWK